MKHWLGVALLLSAMHVPAHAQLVVTGVSSDTLRVGDPFRAVVRINVAPRTEVILPDSLPATEDIENAGRVRSRRDSTERGVSIIAAYPLTAWRPGTLALPSFTALAKSPDRERTLTIDLPSITVLSVLPADTTNIQAKPPKDVLGGNRVWWPWLLAALLLLAALAAAYWWYRRRRSRVVVAPVPAIPPRTHALQELERIQRLGLIERGEFKTFYTLLSEVLRRYMESHDATWSGDLTTEELARRAHRERDVTPAIAVLRSSDLVKFAASVPRAREANTDWEKAREWVNAFRSEPAQLEAA
jgi:hypothetical protein